MGGMVCKLPAIRRGQGPKDMHVACTQHLNEAHQPPPEREGRGRAAPTCQMTSTTRRTHTPVRHSSTAS